MENLPGFLQQLPEPPELTVQHPTGILLWKVSNQWVNALNKALRPFGVTHAQCVLLFLTWRLTGKGDEVSQVRLSEISDMDVMVVSQALRSLESKGLVRREKSKRDARAKAVEVTEAGVSVVASALDVVLKINERFYAALGADDKTLRELLKRLLDDNAVSEE